MLCLRAELPRSCKLRSRATRAITYLCAGQIFIVIKLQSNSIVWRQTHGIDNHNSPPHFIQCIFNVGQFHTFVCLDKILLKKTNQSSISSIKWISGYITAIFAVVCQIRSDTYENKTEFNKPCLYEHNKCDH